MIKFSLQIFNDTTRTKLIADHTQRARQLVFASNEHGCDYASWSVDLPFFEAQQFYNNYRHYDVAISVSGRVQWSGRLEDAIITNTGLTLTAFGYWRAFSDVLYSAFWSSTTSGDWEIARDSNRISGIESISTYDFDKFESDNNNRLYAAVREGETMIGTGSSPSRVVFYFPTVNGGRNIQSFDATVDLTVNSNTWKVDVLSNSAYDGSSTFVSHQDYTTAQASTAMALTGIDDPFLAVALSFNEVADTTVSDETGEQFMRFTGLRVKSTDASTVSSQDIVTDILSAATALNSSQLSSNTSKIADDAQDWKDVAYEDQRADRIIEDLADSGDGTNDWEAMVWEDRIFRFQAKGTEAKTWYADIADITIQRTSANVYNRAYTAYRNEYNEIVRTSEDTDAPSISRYGIEREIYTDSRTTNSGEAEGLRTALLALFSDSPPQASVKLRDIYTESGAWAHPSQVRAHDIIVLRGIIPSSGSDSLDQIKRFRVLDTTYSVDKNELTITPGELLPTIESQLAEALTRGT